MKRLKKKFEHYMFTFQDELDNNIHITYRVSKQVSFSKLLIFGAKIQTFLQLTITNV